MYKSKTMKEISARQHAKDVAGNAGIGRAGARPMKKTDAIKVGIHNARWNVRGKLPKGANRKTNGLIGSMRTGR